MKTYSKERLVFSRKENKKEHLIYSATNRGVYLVPKIVWKFWNNCNNKTLEEICKLTKISKKDAKKIVTLLKKRGLIK
jgi:Txe/YoeB family toxin of Txe-Axe toxin-antitoxin module